MLVDEHARQQPEARRSSASSAASASRRSCRRRPCGWRWPMRPRSCRRRSRPAVALDDRPAEQRSRRSRSDRRSWLPPVMKIAVASSSMLTRRRSLASSRTSGRMPRTSPMPICRNSDRYSSVASSPSEEAVEMTTTRASVPPASETKRAGSGAGGACPRHRR